MAAFGTLCDTQLMELPDSTTETKFATKKHPSQRPMKKKVRFINDTKDKGVKEEIYMNVSERPNVDATSAKTYALLHDFYNVVVKKLEALQADMQVLNNAIFGVISADIDKIEQTLELMQQSMKSSSYKYKRTQSKSHYSRDRSQDRCFTCNDLGHWSPDCPKKRNLQQDFTGGTTLGGGLAVPTQTENDNCIRS
jgi:hypothetical protein